MISYFSYMPITNLQTYYLTPEIGRGKKAVVYAISGVHAVKTLKSMYRNYDPKELLRPELERMILFYENRISVAKPVGFYEVVIRPAPIHLWNSMHEGLIMQRLFGVNGSTLEGKERERAERLMVIEQDKAFELGYHQFSGLINTVYDAKQDRIYLVDLSDWEKMTPQCRKHWEKIRQEVKRGRGY